MTKIHINNVEVLTLKCGYTGIQPKDLPRDGDDDGPNPIEWHEASIYLLPDNKTLELIRVNTADGKDINPPGGGAKRLLTFSRAYEGIIYNIAADIKTLNKLERDYYFIKKQDTSNISETLNKNFPTTDLFTLQPKSKGKPTDTYFLNLKLSDTPSTPQNAKIWLRTILYYDLADNPSHSQIEFDNFPDEQINKQDLVGVNLDTFRGYKIF